MYQSIILAASIFLYSCSSVEPSIIEFDGYTFKLPGEVKEVKNNLNLQYGYYVGFWNGAVSAKSITTQLKGYPFFKGSENDSEESYYGHFFVGTTFFKSEVKLDQIKAQIQNKYGQDFKSNTIDFGIQRSIPPFSMTYHYFITEKGLIVALKEIERKPELKKYISVSFYKGILESELADYLEYVY